MAKKIYHNIIFDLDGTLADTAPDIVYCLKQAFKRVLNRNDIEIGEKLIGPPVPEMIKKIMPDLDSEKVEALTKAFRFCYDSCIFSKTFLYEGAEELLRELKNKKYRLFIVTNKPILPTKKILKKLRIIFFNKVICPDILGGKKLSKNEMIGHLIQDCRLDLEKSVMVGDTANDVDAAKYNKIDSIAVLGGYGQETEIVLSRPNQIVKNIKELLIVFKQ